MRFLAGLQTNGLEFPSVPGGQWVAQEEANEAYKRLREEPHRAITCGIKWN